MTETIYALSTLAGKSGIAVARLSGSRSMEAAQLLGAPQLKDRLATLHELRDPRDEEVIDQAILLYFKSPHSFTGEDVIEIQFHGSLATIDHLLDALAHIPFVRMAEPGEFAKRAFLNSKLDLTQAEGLADLIDSETRLQKRVAIQQLGGRLNTLYSSWRADLLSNLARLEALIDFPEDDIPPSLLAEIDTSLKSLASKISVHLSEGKSGEMLRRGINIAIIGEPNVGKSSLLNALVKGEIAIVSSTAGTTRDVISVRMDIAGFPVTLHDTAGIRETADLIEKEGVSRSLATFDTADIVLHVIDATSSSPLLPFLNDGADKSIIIVYNKVDLLKSTPQRLGPEPQYQYIDISTTSAPSIDNLVEMLASIVRQKYSITNDPVMTHARYRERLNLCLSSLNLFSPSSPLEIASEYIRQASLELGKITGKIDVEEILDEIFSSFCIGK